MNQNLINSQLLQDWQFRFRSKRSTIDAVITLIEEVRQDWNSNTTKTQCLFIELKKAYDSVECDAYGFRRPGLNLPKCDLKTDNNTLPLKPNALKMKI